MKICALSRLRRAWVPHSQSQLHIRLVDWAHTDRSLDYGTEQRACSAAVLKQTSRSALFRHVASEQMTRLRCQYQFASQQSLGGFAKDCRYGSDDFAPPAGHSTDLCTRVKYVAALIISQKDSSNGLQSCQPVSSCELDTWQYLGEI